MRSIRIWAPAAALAAGLVTSAAAQAPVAVVEDVQGKVAGIEFMDYVVPRQVIKLGPRDTIVLGYMRSCWRETITGGTVVVGDEYSLVHLGSVDRQRVDCDAGRTQLTQREASQSAATVVRSMRTRPAAAPHAAVTPRATLHGLSPVVEIKGRGTLVVERLDQPGERHQIAVAPKSLVRGKFYDFAKAGRTLTPGATYVATLGSRQTVFRVDLHAQAGATPIVGRLLRLE
jgi:hypothetical protein